MRLRNKPWALPEMDASEMVALDPAPHLGRWKEWYAEPDKPLSLELGCGKGRFICEIATRRPEHNYLGIDMEANALVFAKRDVEEAGLDNVRLMRIDITRSGLPFDPDSIAEIFIHFCNPWPKKRHHKRRLTHPRQLVQYHRVLQEDGDLWFKTDDLELFEATMQALPGFGFEICASTTDLQPEEDWTGIVTEYEERWRGLGIPIKAIHARKTEIAPALLQERLAVVLAQSS